MAPALNKKNFQEPKTTVLTSGQLLCQTMITDTQTDIPNSNKQKDGRTDRCYQIYFMVDKYGQGLVTSHVCKGSTINHLGGAGRIFADNFFFQSTPNAACSSTGVTSNVKFNKRCYLADPNQGTRSMRCTDLTRQPIKDNNLCVNFPEYKVAMFWCVRVQRDHLTKHYKNIQYFCK